MVKTLKRGASLIEVMIWWGLIVTIAVFAFIALGWGVNTLTSTSGVATIKTSLSNTEMVGKKVAGLSYAGQAILGTKAGISPDVSVKAIDGVAAGVTPTTLNSGKQFLVVAVNPYPNTGSGTNAEGVISDGTTLDATNYLTSGSTGTDAATQINYTKYIVTGAELTSIPANLMYVGTGTLNAGTSYIYKLQN